MTELGSNPFAGCYKLNIECNSPLYIYENNALFSSDRKTILAYIDYGESTYSIPNTITNIGEHAFLENETLNHVYMPDSIICIESNAFWGCRKIEKIDISSSVESIGNGAFGWCESLVKVAIPNSVIEIGPYAFYHCTSLKEISIPASVERIGAHAFRFCDAVERIIIPKGTKDKYAKMIWHELRNRLVEKDLK